MERLIPCIIYIQDDKQPTRYFKGFSGTGRPYFDVNEHLAKIIFREKDLRAYLKFVPLMMKSFKMYPNAQIHTLKVELINE